MKDELYIGSMGWSYDFWKLYPEHIPKSDYLQVYSQNFNSVEINSSFYRIPSSATVKNWAEQTPKNFKFSTKFPRSITHVKDLNFEAGRLEAFLKNMNHLGSKLGPFLIQFPPRFDAKKIAKLTKFLEKLPDKYEFSIEFRNKSWLTPEAFENLRDYNVSIVQGGYLETQVHFTALGNLVYIRLEGDRDEVNGDRGLVEVDKYEELDLWAKRIKDFMENDREVYVYISKYYSGYPPSDIEYLSSKVKKL
ncbi:DUF72 domain-containing protein [Candidatus Bathyarchaeota archaeon]|nr:DUF72 domain-containing protein [Candidatus Bathyarchaeota archaeon]